MKFDSPLFDRIRVRPDQDRSAEDSTPVCEHPGCDRKGGYRAPKGRGEKGRYWNFCLEHVKAYNHSYNFFAGLEDDAIRTYQKDAMTGHRPTWRMGANAGPQKGPSAKAARPDPENFGLKGEFDPFDVFGHLGGQARQRTQTRAQTEDRSVRNAERRAFAALGLELDTPAAQIKARYKELVKRHHPDANGGDRSHEDRLREIIQAYGYLRSVGFC